MSQSFATELLEPSSETYRLLFRVLEEMLEMRCLVKVDACLKLIDAVILASYSPPPDTVLEQLVGLHEEAWHLRQSSVRPSHSVLESFSRPWLC